MGELTLRQRLQGLADQEVDERPVRVIAARLLAAEAALQVDRPGRDFGQILSGFFADRFLGRSSSSVVVRSVVALAFILIVFFGSLAIFVVGRCRLPSMNASTRRPVSPSDFADVVAGGVVDDDHPTIQLGLPDTRHRVGRRLFQETLVDGAELLDIQFPIGKLHETRLALRRRHAGEEFQHVVDGGVAPGQAVDQLRAAGAEQAAAIGLDDPSAPKRQPARNRANRACNDS